MKTPWSDNSTSEPDESFINATKRKLKNVKKASYTLLSQNELNQREEDLEETESETNFDESSDSIADLDMAQYGSYFTEVCIK